MTEKEREREKEREIFAELGDLIVEIQSGSIEKVKELIKATKKILGKKE